MGMAAESAEDAVIVRSTNDLGHNLGLKVVAEGVEDQRTFDQLAAIGCDTAQGYFMARPMPAPDVSAFLRDSRWKLAN
jgi:EAL domain-containing protein (putative c-di-GMP-specific phosphodiesterase class I)